jgi:hypothetical protein
VIVGLPKEPNDAVESWCLALTKERIGVMLASKNSASSEPGFASRVPIEVGERIHSFPYSHPQKAIAALKQSSGDDTGHRNSSEMGGAKR